MSSKNRCSICRKTFSRPDSLRRHLLNIHSDEDSETSGSGSETPQQGLQYSQSEEQITLPKYIIERIVDDLTKYLSDDQK